MRLTSSKAKLAATTTNDALQDAQDDHDGADEKLGQGVKRKAHFVWFLLVAMFAATGAAAYLWEGPTSEDPASLNTVPVETGEFTVKVSDLGVLRALDSVSVSAEKDLPIIWLVPEGSSVKKGDVIVRFDATKYDLAYESAQASVKVAQANVQKAMRDLDAVRQRRLAENARFEAELELAQIALAELKRRPLPDELARAKGEYEKALLTLEGAERQWKVMPKLIKLGYIEGSTYDSAKFKVLESRLNVVNTKMALDKISAGATADELKQAGIRVKQTKTAVAKAKRGMLSELKSFKAAIAREQANVEMAKKELLRAFEKRKRRELLAPRDGLVVYATDGTKGATKKIQLGMIPFQGQPLVELPNLSTMVVETEVNEFDIGKVTVGAPVNIRIEAYPGKIFKGTVHKIGTLARNKETADGKDSSVKTFNVIVKIDEQDPRLKPGLTANVDIISLHRKNAISVPLVAVESENDRHFVRIADAAGKVEKRAIDIGPSNETSVLVEKGLRAGENVVVDLPMTATQ